MFAINNLKYTIYIHVLFFILPSAILFCLLVNINISKTPLLKKVNTIKFLDLKQQTQKLLTPPIKHLTNIKVDQSRDD